jgi:Na+/phosphate symporter
MKKKHRALYDYWKYKKGRKGIMDFNNPIFQTLFGLLVFYIGLKMFSGGMKSMGKLEHLEYFIHNPYWMFLGGIACTLLWQSSSLSTTAIIGLVASGALPLPSAIAAVLGANIGTTGTIWLAGIMVSDGMPQGITKQIAIIHTGVNALMAVMLLPFIQPIAKFISRF